jgi:hypothetical protein
MKKYFKNYCFLHILPRLLSRGNEELPPLLWALAQQRAANTPQFAVGLFIFLLCQSPNTYTFLKRQEKSSQRNP